MVVLVCVPALTRIGQRLEPVSHGVSFSKNIEGPPKKVTVAPLFAVVSPMRLKAFAPVPALPMVAAPDAMRPRSLDRSSPPPLRAPPSALLG
jgi:hypothetical protein